MEKFLVVKVGREGWSIHSTHGTREAAEQEASRNNTFPDAQFSVWDAASYERFRAA